MRFYFKAFLSLLSVAGVLLTLYVVYTLQYAKEKPAWLLSYKSKVMSEIESRSLKKKTYIERIQNCMDSAKVCEETSADKDALSCDKGRFSLFFRCAGFKKDERTVAPVDSDYH